MVRGGWRWLLAGALAVTALIGQANAATLYISEFVNGVSTVGTTLPPVPPQPSVANQTVALSGASAQSAAFNSKTRVVSLICDEGCSVSFGDNPTATTTNYLLQQGVPVSFGVIQGQKVAVIYNPAGNSGGGGGGGGGTSSSFGATFPLTGTAAGFINSATGNMVGATVDNGSGGLNVNIVGGGGSGGTSSNFGSAFPSAGTAAGFTDGTDMRAAQVFDLDTGAGTEYDIGASIRLPSSGGSVAGGTATNPLRVDPTGTTTQPVSGTVTANAGTGNFTVVQGTATNLKAQVVGAGTAGSQTGGVLTVQGDPSGTPIPISGSTTVSGTVTANQGTSPWVVSNGGTFAVQATQAGSWTVTANAGTNLNTSALALDATVAKLNLAQGSTTSGQTGPLVQGAVTTSAPSYTTAQTSPLSLTTAGALRIDGSGSTQPVSGTVTANQGGSWTVTANAGTNLNTSALATSANQTNASQKTQIVDGSGNVIGSTSNNLNVQCANCSASGVSQTDEGTFTAGTSAFASAGGFYQTTATSNALTNGQYGTFQTTANRALFTNLRNATGTEVGTATTPLQVSLANTGSNSTAVTVTGAGGSFPVTGATSNASSAVATSSTNVPSVAYNYAFNGTTWDQLQDDASKNLKVAVNAALPAGTNVIGHVITDSGSTTAVTQTTSPWIVAGGGTAGSPGTAALTIQGIGSGTPVPVSGTFFQATQPISIASGQVASGAYSSGSIASGAVASGAVASGAYVSGSIADGAVVTLGAKADAKSTATDTTAVTAMQVLKEISFQAQNPAALPSNQSTNEAQINGVTPLMGNGVTGTGSQRVTIASDNTSNSNPWLVNGNVTPADAAALGTTSIRTYSLGGVYNGSTVDLAREAANSTNSTGTGLPSAQVMGQCDDVSQTAITENSFGNARIDCATHAQVVTLAPSATVGGTSLFTLTAAASTNATNVKNAAGQVYGISGYTISATPAWLSLYNNSGTPTCGTSIIQQYLIPGNTSGSGFNISFDVPKGFATGIAFCLTTGIAGTGSVAATSYVVNFDFK